MKRFSKGFTLIELLIVIAIIGILAVAILSAINPVEQIAKGNDTGKKSDAAEYLNAVERYYATFQCYPWQNIAGVCTPEAADTDAILSSLGQGNTGSGITELIEKNELKDQFKNRSDLAKINRHYFATTKQVSVGFLPDSKTFKATAKYSDFTCVSQVAPLIATCIPE